MVLLIIVLTISILVVFSTFSFSASPSQYNIITRVRALYESGGVEVTDISWYPAFRIEARFFIPKQTVYADDKIAYRIPRELKFYKEQEFQIKDTLGAVIAKASLSNRDKTITISYTEKVESETSINGKFFFHVRIDRNIVAKEKDIPIYLETPSNNRTGGKPIHFTGYSDPEKKYIVKKGFQANGVHRNELHYKILINTIQKEIQNVLVTDKITTPDMQIAMDSFRIYKCRWEKDRGEWVARDRRDVTKEHSTYWIKSTPGFSVFLGNIEKESGYELEYTARATYNFADGEIIYGEAAISAMNLSPTYSVSTTTYNKTKSASEGYTHIIRVVKTDRDENRLPGAIFDVVRIATNAVVGTVITGADGVGEIRYLLKDEYILKEIKAPAGYIKKDTVTHVSADDFRKGKVAELIVHNEMITTSVAVTRIWEGEEGLSSTIRLFADGELVRIRTITDVDAWRFNFTDLPKYASSDGHEIVYTVDELSDEGKKADVACVKENEFVITS